MKYLHVEFKTGVGLDRSDAFCANQEAVVQSGARR